MKGLDLRKLKKVSSDDKTTTFKHDNGHELKVAHSGLSAKLLKELQSLPMHGQKMKDGGEPDPQPNVSPDDSVQPAPAAPVSVPADYTQGASAPGAVATTGNNPNNPIQDQTAQAPDASQGAAPPAWGDKTSAASAQPMTAGQVLTQPVSSGDALAHLNEQTQALRTDFNNGQITPKTYNDLFAKKDTLGKLGMMFGLIAGGAGAGLSHQPNALLGMMDKEIDRDLEAQKQTKSNQYNALNLAETHYRNEVASHLTEQQAKLTNQQAALANANIKLLAQSTTKASMENAAEQHFMQKAGLLPENTQNGQKARAAAGFVSNAITQQQAQRNQQLAQQIEANGQQSQQHGQEQSGYILGPDAQSIYQSLQYDPTKTSQQKSDIQQQYAKTVQTEKALKQIDQLYPLAAGSTTVAGSVANALEGTVGKVPFGIGEVLGQLPGEAIRDIGGQKEKQQQAYRAQLEGYIDSALENTGATPTDKADMARKYFPNEGDDANTKAVKLKGLKDKIINLTHTSALDAAGMTRK